MALSNILIKKNTYEYDILNRYNDIRKEYGYEQLPITIEPLKWEN
jgi:hypothetical protein